MAVKKNHWQRILHTTILDNQYTKGFEERFYGFLRTFALEIEQLNITGHPRIIHQNRFEEICERTLPHTHYIDHTTLNFGPGRLEEAAEMAMKKGFDATDYFLPLDKKTGMISIVVGKHDKNLYFAMNEGLDGWTEETVRRIKEFQKFLDKIFEKTPILLPKIHELQDVTEIEIKRDEKDRITSTTQTRTTMLPIKLPNTPLLHIKIDNKVEKSHITLGVEEHGEFLQHYALDALRIIDRSIPLYYPCPRTPRTIEELFIRLRDEDILPLVSEKILTGFAGRTPEDRHEVKQFFAKELACGWFPEFIERMGERAERGYFVASTVGGLYHDKEKELEQK